MERPFSQHQVRCAQEIDHENGGNNNESLDHLDIEPDPDENDRDEEPREGPLPCGPDGDPDRQKKDKDELGVHRAVPGDRDENGGYGKSKGCNKTCRFSEGTGDNEIDEGDRADPCKGLREDEDPAAETQILRQRPPVPRGRRGGLSTVTNPAGSKELKKPAAGFTSVLLTAAA